MNIVQNTLYSKLYDVQFFFCLGAERQSGVGTAGQLELWPVQLWVGLIPRPVERDMSSVNGAKVQMLKTLSTLFRAQVAEAEEAIFDANATRLLEQRLREANAAFEAGKRDLAMVLAEEAGEHRLAADLGQRIAEEEAAAIKALEAGRESEAERLAERIATATDDQKAHKDAAANCGEAAARIRRALESNARLLAELKRGLATAKAAAAVNRANARSLSTAGVTDSAIQDARRTLERIRVRQGEQTDFVEAMERVERDPTLKAPGEIQARRWPETDPKSVLDRLKARGVSSPVP